MTEIRLPDGSIRSFEESVSQSNTSNTHRPPMKKPPKDPIKSLQLDLFSHFVTNDLSQVSNTVELWERIPKYFFTTKQAEKLRTIDGLAKPYKWTYKENGIARKVM